jgi:hypothetical protein
VLSKNVVEAKWTGLGKPSQAAMNVVRTFHQQYKKEGGKVHFK